MGKVHLVRSSEVVKRHAVYGIIRDGQGVLLIKDRSSGSTWDLPGGGVEQAESPLKALHREIKEETGLDVVGHPKEICEVFEYFYDLDSKSAWQSRRCFYEVRCAGQVIEAGNGDDVLLAKYLSKPLDRKDVGASTRAVLAITGF